MRLIKKSSSEYTIREVFIETDEDLGDIYEYEATAIYYDGYGEILDSEIVDSPTKESLIQKLNEMKSEGWTIL